MTIVVGGASGHLGRRAAELLFERVPPSEVVLSTRTPDALEDLAARGAVVRHGDYDHPETLADAFAGGKALLWSGVTFGFDQRTCKVATGSSGGGFVGEGSVPGAPA